MDDWMTTDAAAQHIGVTRATLHEWRRRGVVRRDAVREMGMLRKVYRWQPDEVARLRKVYNAKNDRAVAA